MILKGIYFIVCCFTEFRPLMVDINEIRTKNKAWKALSSLQSDYIEKKNIGS